MDERTNNEQLKLEDILEEYGDFKPAEEVPAQEEDVRVWDGTPEQPAEAVSGDTVRLPNLSKATRRKTQVADQTVSFAPVGGGDAMPQAPAYTYVEPPKKEPYSQGWEPEYEQPIGEYVPQEPIVFQPKSRLKELKKKLVAGPEKRYYELTELGLGKLQLALILCALVAILSACATAFYAMGHVPENRMRLMVFGQLAGLLIAALLGSYQLMEGFSDLMNRSFTPNTLLIFSLVACIADGILCLYQVRVPCCAPFSLNMTMSLWGAYQRRNTEMGQMDTMRKAVRLDSVVLEEYYYNDRPGFIRGEGQVEDFMDTYRMPSGAERTLNVYSLISLFLCLGIGITAGVYSGVAAGMRFFSASLLIAVPATSYIALSRPMAILERRLHRLGTVICGWQGVRGLNARGVFPISHEDLFPAGAAKLNGLKFYGSRNPDQVVAYGTAVIEAAGGSLAPVFIQLLDSRNGYHYQVEALRHYPHGGVGGVVNGEVVLVGTLAFMEQMDVEIPQGARITQAVYVAVDGVLNGVFAITYQRMKSAATGLTTLCAYRGLTPAVVSGDFMLSPELIGSKFGVKTKRILFPERRIREEMAARTAAEESPVLALTTKDGLAGSAFAITGARVLRNASNMGVAVQMMGGILGLLIMLALTVIGAQHLLTPENLLLYELVWMIPGVLITEWTRTI